MKAEDLDVRTLVNSLRCCTCPACRRIKKPAQTLCGACYKKLPAPKRRALYNRVGEGYEQAVADAFNTLGVAEFYFKPGVI